MAVLEYKLDGEVIYQRENSNYIFPLVESEKEQIIKIWGEYKNGTYFNAENVRIQYIEHLNEKTIIGVSKVDFYSLIIANIMRGQFIDFKEYIQSHYSDYGLKDIVNRLSAYYDSISKYKDFLSMIQDGKLPNALAVSVVLTDENGMVVLAKRSNKVAIGANLYSVTVTGAVDSEDWNESDIIRNCAKRELVEELNINLPIQNFETVAIVAGENKLQPIAIVNAHFYGDINSCINSIRYAHDYELEIERIHICHREDIKKILQSQRFTEAAEYHLGRVAL